MKNDEQTIAAILAQGSDRLRDAGIESARLDAELLMMHLLDWPRETLYTRMHFALTNEEKNQYFALVERREAQTPLQYITGNCEFMGMQFLVNPHVLIPRPDTETVVEMILNHFSAFTADLKPGASPMLIGELCTGSGCIAVSLAHFLNNCRFIASDISLKALETAKENAFCNNVFNQIVFLAGDLFGCYHEQMYGALDAIVANPPYIKTQDIDGLAATVCEYEPRHALDGGADGLRFYRQIAQNAGAYLKAEGVLFLEIGYDQLPAVTQILKDAGFNHVKTQLDLAGHTRAVKAYR